MEKIKIPFGTIYETINTPTEPYIIFSRRTEIPSGERNAIIFINLRGECFPCQRQSNYHKLNDIKIIKHL